MKFFFRRAWWLLLCIAVIGCDTLPDGIPPHGGLVDNAPPAEESELARHNRQVLQLSAFFLQSGVRKIAVADEYARKVAVDAAMMSGVVISSDAELLLVAAGGTDKELLLRFSDGRVRWQSGR